MNSIGDWLHQASFTYFSFSTLTYLDSTNLLPDVGEADNLTGREGQDTFILGEVDQMY